MHRFRITLSGAPRTIAPAGRALEAAGAARLDPRVRGGYAWEHEDGLTAIARLSREHPVVSFGVETFEDFSDALVLAVVTAGTVETVATQRVLPAEPAVAADPAGQPIALERLVRAARAVAPDATLAAGSPLEVALALAARVGRFAGAVREHVAAPSPPALEAVAALAGVALRVEAGAQERSPGELRYLVPLRLTQSVLRAHRGTYDDAARRDWPWWLGVLLAAGGELVEEAYRADDGSRVERSARSLLTACVQVLARFGGA